MNNCNLRDLLSIVKFSRSKDRSFKDVISKTVGLYPLVCSVTQSELEEVLTPKRIIEVYGKGVSLLEEGLESKTYGEVQATADDTAEAHKVYNNLRPDFVIKAICEETIKFL